MFQDKRHSLFGDETKALRHLGNREHNFWLTLEPVSGEGTDEHVGLMSIRVAESQVNPFEDIAEEMVLTII